MIRSIWKSRVVMNLRISVDREIEHKFYQAQSLWPVVANILISFYFLCWKISYNYNISFNCVVIATGRVTQYHGLAISALVQKVLGSNHPISDAPTCLRILGFAIEWSMKLSPSKLQVLLPLPVIGTKILIMILPFSLHLRSSLPFSPRGGEGVMDGWVDGRVEGGREEGRREGHQ